ncbi:MAG TPA: hypothetical protein HA261_07860 [Methanosarcina sp.]|nr:hypothetical protein [Methanosarcina sp.]
MKIKNGICGALPILRKRIGKIIILQLITYVQCLQYFFCLRSPDLPYRICKLSIFIFLYLIKPVIECSRIPVKDIKIPTRVSKNIPTADSKPTLPPGSEVCTRLRAIYSPPAIRMRPGRVKQYRGLLNSMSLKVLSRILIPCLKGFASERVASHI